MNVAQDWTRRRFYRHRKLSSFFSQKIFWNILQLHTPANLFKTFVFPQIQILRHSDDSSPYKHLRAEMSGFCFKKIEKHPTTKEKMLKTANVLRELSQKRKKNTHFCSKDIFAAARCSGHIGSFSVFVSHQNSKSFGKKWLLLFGIRPNSEELQQLCLQTERNNTSPRFSFLLGVFRFLFRLNRKPEKVRWVWRKQVRQMFSAWKPTGVCSCSRQTDVEANEFPVWIYISPAQMAYQKVTLGWLLFCLTGL